MHALNPRWPAYGLLAGYTLLMKVLPYALMAAGFPIDQTLAAYPWNFSPALAFCLFGGAALPRRSLSLWVPLIVWLAGDLSIWALTGRFDWAFYPALAGVYLAFALTIVCGWWLRRHCHWWSVAGSAFAVSWMFFLLTNTACWVGNRKYPQTAGGLAACLVAGLPFQRNLLVSTLVFSGILFSPLGVRSRAAVVQPATVVVH